MRLLILKLSATLALWLCGCSLPPINVQPTPTPQPTPAPQQVELKISVGGDGKITVAGGADVNVKNASQPTSPAVERCDCGCEKESCRCSSRAADKRTSAADTTTRSGPQIVSALRDPKPIVEMLTDFDDGVCGACDLAWSDWKTNGKDWPFVLVKKRGTGGRTSPTFRFGDGKIWSPQTYSVGGLAEYWRGHTK